MHGGLGHAEGAQDPHAEVALGPLDQVGGTADPPATNQRRLASLSREASAASSSSEAKMREEIITRTA
nr:hypothetical protein [Nocardioides humi]